MKTSVAVAPTEAVDVKVVDGVVVLTVHGRLDHEVGDVLFAASWQALRQSGSRRILLDLQAANLVEDTAEVLGRVNAADAQPELAQARVALLCRSITNNHIFLESAARRHGHDMKVLTDGETAWRWLLEPTETPDAEALGR